jgi:D-alanyl-lipoteichoic acid acyltransferase DltB (MBOAT superfamily)
MVPPLITMLVSGFWHGAGWTYIAWGLFYGFVIIIYQQLGAGVKWRSNRPVKTTLAWSIMFSIIVFGWMLFKAPSLDWLANILISAPFIGTDVQLTASLVSLSMIAFYSAPLVIKFMLDRSLKNNSALLGAYYALATVLTIIYANSSSPDFIYFQF